MTNEDETGEDRGGKVRAWKSGVHSRLWADGKKRGPKGHEQTCVGARKHRLKLEDVLKKVWKNSGLAGLQ